MQRILCFISIGVLMCLYATEQQAPVKDTLTGDLENVVGVSK